MFLCKLLLCDDWIDLMNEWKWDMQWVKMTASVSKVTPSAAFWSHFCFKWVTKLRLANSYFTFYSSSLPTQLTDNIILKLILTFLSLICSCCGKGLQQHCMLMLNLNDQNRSNVSTDNPTLWLSSVRENRLNTVKFVSSTQSKVLTKNTFCSTRRDVIVNVHLNYLLN